MSDTLPIFDLRTHRGTLDFPDQVNAYLSKELKLCTIAGPFDTVPLAQGFVVSPLNTVVKLACVAGWIRERASGGGAAILILPRWRSPRVKFHGLFTKPLTASPLAFTASLPKEKHSHVKSCQLRRLW